jgi:hypothetical protein
MADDVMSFGFENEDIKGGVYDKYKGKKGETHRGSFIYTDPKAMFVGGKTHFKDRYFLCKKSICCEKLGAPKWRVASVLIKYGTDKIGNIKMPFEYGLFPWFFSETTFMKLKGINSEFPLTTHDIKISCTNEEYQHLDITPCSESIWQAKAELKAKVLEEAKPIWDYIKKGVAGDLSIEEIKDLLSMGGTTADPTSKIDLDSVLKTV